MFWHGTIMETDAALWRGLPVPIVYITSTARRPKLEPRRSMACQPNPLVILPLSLLKTFAVELFSVSGVYLFREIRCEEYRRKAALPPSDEICRLPVVQVSDLMSKAFEDLSRPAEKIYYGPCDLHGNSQCSCHASCRSIWKTV
jgi:hypothetical protein